MLPKECMETWFEFFFLYDIITVIWEYYKQFDVMQQGWDFMSWKEERSLYKFFSSQDPDKLCIEYTTE